MKSDASTLLEVALCVFTDVKAMCSDTKSAVKDVDTLTSRVKDEGLSFLTITLPSFGQDIERCLDLGYVDPKYFRSFRKYRRIPAFMRGIVGQIFDADTGRILDAPSVKAIECVRQIAYTFKKLKTPCSSERIERAFEGYVSDEHDLEVPIAPDDVRLFTDVSDRLWSWLSRYRDEWYGSVIPKHGPGATAEGITGNKKYTFHTWHDRLEPYFPLTQYAFGSLSAIESEEFEKVTIIPEDEELPVKVITVPKTLKSPRIIAIEPVCMQYTQQAISRFLVGVIENARMTSGHVNFTNQGVNQALALRSSRDGSMATLDLSSASDRVERELALSMFNCVPDLRDAIDACRSKRAALPDGRILTLRKFASMGSALCFPVESMYFYTICIVGLLQSRCLPVTSRNIFKMTREVYIYGDDIVVPANDSDAVIAHLHKYHCKVNFNKTFGVGKFRESCGVDAYDGKSVTPTYLRELPPDNRQSASQLVSWVATANLFFQRGFYNTSEYLYKRCEKIIGKLPIVLDTCAGLGRVVGSGHYSIERWDRQLQVPKVRAWVAKPSYRKDKISGYPALLKCLLALERKGRKQNYLKLTSADEDHLDKTARFDAVALQRRWVRPY